MKRNMELLKRWLVFAILPAFLIACGSPREKQQAKNENDKNVKEMKHVDWSKNANIYEVNIRQYTPEGTINEFKKHLPRLKEMGVDILWLMPVQPIGEMNRKGSLGSYYSVKDYKAVNPEFGTMQDLKFLVRNAHEMGMYVILDWVANHSAWDNVWAKEHPDFYEKNDDGTFVSPFDWTDVISFDYNNPAMRNSMISALEFWINEADVDGYRCDVAGMVPTDFWNDAVARMKQIKPIFMLAEDEDNVALTEHAFDMNYSWKLMHLMNDIAKGDKKAHDVWGYLQWNDSVFSKDVYRMTFITNHDENSWNGTAKQRLGDGVQAFAVLTYTLPGMPLIYSGQEAGNDKVLRFFEKDTIDWSNIIYEDFYTKLNHLKKDHPALWNGEDGGEIINVGEGGDENLLAFLRVKDNDKVLAVINLSGADVEFRPSSERAYGTYTNLFTGEKMDIGKDTVLQLGPWAYYVLTN